MGPPIRRFIVLGAGGHGRVVADLVRTLGYDVVGYADADVGRMGTVADATGARVILTQTELVACGRGERPWPRGASAIALGIGDNGARARARRTLAHDSLPALLHPRAWVSGAARLRAGVVVLAGAVVNTGVRIGDGAIVNSHATVEHDCLLGSDVHVSPGATVCGSVTIGDESWIGAGAVIIPGRHLAKRCVVGAGAVVIRDVAIDATVVGNPAHPLTRVTRHRDAALVITSEPAYAAAGGVRP